MKNTIAALLTVAGLASSALALQNGDIVFTNFNTDSIDLIENPGGSNTHTSLISFNDIVGAPGDNPIRLAGITRGPSGEFYVADGSVLASDIDFNSSRIIRVDGLLSGAPVASNFLTGAGASSVQNPVGIEYDANYGGLLWVQNPFRTFAGQPIEDGLYGSTLAAPSSTQFFMEDNSAPRPRYEAGSYLVKEPGRNSYLVTSLNGGLGAGFSDNRASTLWRFTPDTNNPANSTMELVRDFSAMLQTETLVQVRGITAGPNPGEYFITNTSEGIGEGPYAPAGVYRLLLDNNGDFQSLDYITGQVSNPETIIYNPFTNKLVVDSATNNAGGIFQMNLDGSGVELLVANTHARGFYIVPTPGAAALLGLGGLAAFGRRRR